MDAALLKRLRSAPAISSAAGVFNGKPAIDHDERKSNDATAFPAAIQTIVAGPETYDQDKRLAARTWRIRWETFSLKSHDGAAALARAIAETLEEPATEHGVRFARGFVRLSRSGGVEDVGELRIFRRILDMDITATY